jgi:F-box protein 9
MHPQDVPTNTEAELESFRQKWREEVTARSKGKAPATTKTSAASSSKPQPSKSNAPDAHPISHARQRSVEEDEVTPYAYRGLGEKQHGRRLDETSAQTAAASAASQGPNSALEHYEKAVEKESQGKLGDSVAHYRRAFKVRLMSSFRQLDLF